MDERTLCGPRIPPELCLWIIDVIYLTELSIVWSSALDAQRAALSTLYACALTCSSWRDHAQYLLFHVIHLRSVRALRSLTDVIRASPRLGTYVEKITLFHDYPNSPDSATATFPASLKSLLPRLQVVQMYSTDSKTTGKSTSLPLHQRFPLWLGSFQTVTIFMLGSTTFASFGTFLRVVNAFPHLMHLHLLDGIKWHTVGHLPPFMTTAEGGHEAGNESLSSRRRKFLPHLQDLSIGEPWPRDELQTLLASLRPSTEELWLPHPLIKAELLGTSTSDVDGGIADVETQPESAPFVSLAHLKTPKVAIYIGPGGNTPYHLASLWKTLHSWWPPVEAPVSLLSRRTIGMMPMREEKLSRNDFLSPLLSLGSELEEMVYAPIPSQTEYTAESVPLDVEVWLWDKDERWTDWDSAVSACFPRLSKLGALRTKFEHPHASAYEWQDYNSAEPLRLPETSPVVVSPKTAENSVSTTNLIENCQLSLSADVQTDFAT